MHGRPRKSAQAEDATATAKASNLRELQSQLLHNHHQRLYSKEAIDTSSKLLDINPEIPTAWNYRKLAFQHNVQEASDPPHVKSLVNDELRVVEMALRRNPKSYGAWYHRKWVLTQGLLEVDFDREFALLDQLLKADARNFHGWNYRRFLSKIKDVPEVEELKFTMDMIDTNFSNYSAWHNRSAFLSRLLSKKADGFDEREKILTEEYDLVRQALFTDPSDQSGWFYHLWLLDQTASPGKVLLLSSWPFDGSNWLLTVDEDKIHCKLSQSSCSSYYFLDTGKLPVVLYFNQAVRGVNSSSVIVNSMFVDNEDLIWRPVTPTKSEHSACWVVYIGIPDFQKNDTEVYTVEVKIGHSEDIISSDGCLFGHPLQFRFNLHLNSKILEHAEANSIDELFVWNDDGSPAVENCSFLPVNQSEDYALEFSKWNLETISYEINLFRELEENCKFVKLTLARLLVAQDAMMSYRTRRSIHSREVCELFDDLIRLDPMHAGYYEDERSLVCMNKVTSDEQSLMSKNSRSSNYLSSKLPLLGCLQLKNLSLTRVGSVDRLLWVQVLDLSDNKLRSVAGIEALQLLSCLNLRNNQISSFTALEPLKLLSYLRVLDVSFNEIGAHPVNTTRYLYSSPSLAEDRREADVDVDVAGRWEAVLLFREMHLKQLDVKGNAVADENFGELLMKLIPTLIWLDGERL